jgi:hypothetical protein
MVAIIKTVYLGVFRTFLNLYNYSSRNIILLFVETPRKFITAEINLYYAMFQQTIV